MGARHAKKGSHLEIEIRESEPKRSHCSAPPGAPSEPPPHLSLFIPTGLLSWEDGACPVGRLCALGCTCFRPERVLPALKPRASCWEEHNTPGSRAVGSLHPHRTWAGIWQIASQPFVNRNLSAHVLIVLSLKLANFLAFRITLSACLLGR